MQCGTLNIITPSSFPGTTIEKTRNSGSLTFVLPSTFIVKDASTNLVDLTAICPIASYVAVIEARNVGIVT